VTYSREERLALCDLLDATGPDAPTLCEGWLTRDLAAHLVLRERRPDAAAGVLGGPLAGHTERVQRRLAERRTYAQLVRAFRDGPPRERPPVNLGDIVFGKIVEITDEAIFVDIPGKAKAIFDRRELLLPEDDEAPPPPSPAVEAATATEAEKAAEAAPAGDMATAPEAGAAAEGASTSEGASTPEAASGSA